MPQGHHQGRPSREAATKLRIVQIESVIRSLKRRVVRNETKNNWTHPKNHTTLIRVKQGKNERKLRVNIFQRLWHAITVDSRIAELKQITEEINPVTQSLLRRVILPNARQPPANSKIHGVKNQEHHRRQLSTRVPNRRPLLKTPLPQQLKKVNALLLPSNHRTFEKRNFLEQEPSDS